MNGYKKYIKSSRVRKAILNVLCFIPDTSMLKLQYYIKLKRKLNFKKPERFTEKLQWYKLNYHNPVLHECVDKYRVRQYVENKGLKDILVPLITKYEDVKSVDWNELPNQFVMKTTNGGGGLNVLVCRNKNKISWDSVKNKFLSSDKIFRKRTGGREWAYYGLKRHIIVEKLLINDKHANAGINDYKIFCYDGNPKYIVMDIDRYTDHKRNFYDAEWNNLYISSDCPSSNKAISKPKNFDMMLNIARKLSEDFPFVRVDLYNLEGKIYFGELTFYPWSGYVNFTPDSFDFELGKDFILPKTISN